jgi:Hypothetical glycosyl hydrolase family 15
MTRLMTTALLVMGVMLLAPFDVLLAADDLPNGSWDHVPLYIHFGKRNSEMTEAELDFLAKHSRLIVLEKGHGVVAHGSTEAGVADTARRLKQRNPAVKVLFYFNAFINWPGYESFKTFRPEWNLRATNGQIVTLKSGPPRPDPSNAEFREWWSEVVAAEMKRGPLDGVFADALPQALGAALAKEVGATKAKAVAAGLREMLALTKRKIGADKIILANGTRGVDFREILDWNGIDGVMIEHFDSFRSDQPTTIKADLDTISLAASKRKFVVIKGWPGFNWFDTALMKHPHEELLKRARDNITFPLACFLVSAQPGSWFCYSWGYKNSEGMLDDYPEFDRPLGPPKADATWAGLNATREFEHASVFVDLEKKTARINWK